MNSLSLALDVIEKEIVEGRVHKKKNKRARKRAYDESNENEGQQVKKSTRFDDMTQLYRQGRLYTRIAERLKEESVKVAKHSRQIRKLKQLNKKLTKQCEEHQQEMADLKGQFEDLKQQLKCSTEKFDRFEPYFGENRLHGRAKISYAFIKCEHDDCKFWVQKASKSTIEEFTTEK